MVEKFLDQWEAIFAALSDSRIKKEDVQTLKETDLAELISLQALLKPLQDATVMMCEEKTPTVSMLIPMSEKLKHCFEPSENDSILIKKKLQKSNG